MPILRRQLGGHGLVYRIWYHTKFLRLNLSIKHTHRLKNDSSANERDPVLQDTSLHEKMGESHVMAAKAKIEDGSERP